MSIFGFPPNLNPPCDEELVISGMFNSSIHLYGWLSNFNNHHYLLITGKGTFGTVFTYVDPITKEKTAIKKQCFETLLHNHMAWLTPYKIKNEIKLNMKLQNINGIVQFINYWIAGPHVTEILNGTHEFLKASSSGARIVPVDLSHFFYMQFENCDTTLENLLDPRTCFSYLNIKTHILAFWRFEYTVFEKQSGIHGSQRV